MFEFVTMDPAGRALPADRTRIRSRAALEKNKRQDSRRSRREAKRLALSQKEAIAHSSLPPPPPHDLQLVPFAERIGGESKELLYKSTQSFTHQRTLNLADQCSIFLQNPRTWQASAREMRRLYVMGLCLFRVAATRHCIPTISPYFSSHGG